jgi:DNA-binding MarR family transcriptional regulator
LTIETMLKRHLSDRKVRLSRETGEALIGELVSEIRRHQNAQDLFDDAACAYLGINRTDGRCLDILDQHGRMTAGALARASGLSSGAATTLIDRLERAGYVRRVRDTEDRRRVLVEMTDEARRRAWEVWGPIAEETGRIFDGYDDAQLALFRDFTRTARELLERHRERVRALGP